MINFKTWIENKEENPIIFLDLDETLVSTNKVQLFKNLEEIKTLGGVLITNSHASFLRSHAINFVNNLKAIAKVCIITAGGSVFQKKVIKALGIPIDENDIFGIEEYEFLAPEKNKLPKSKKSILVDDLDPTAGNTMAKLYALGIDEDKHVKVKPFNFSPVIAKRFPRIFKNDTELLDIQPIVISTLNKD
jgi:hypothetical protein